MVNRGVPARRSTSKLYDYELERLPAQAHHFRNSLRWSHPTIKNDHSVVGLVW
ncbi:MAG: hypothetical protein ACI8P0_000745 [Planctomycetaceae bacterium]|jgi:hypothetical protein